jgi:hypothetical protein
VRARIFVCMLAYYVEWHMSEKWRALLFADEDLEAKRLRDPVAAAKRSPERCTRSPSARWRTARRYSLRTLLQELATIVCNTCVTRGAKTAAPLVPLLAPQKLTSSGYGTLYRKQSPGCSPASGEYSSSSAAFSAAQGENLAHAPPAVGTHDRRAVCCNQ